jgi:hypothetical protein
VEFPSPPASRWSGLILNCAHRPSTALNLKILLILRARAASTEDQPDHLPLRSQPVDDDLMHDRILA